MFFIIYIIVFLAVAIQYIYCLQLQKYKHFSKKIAHTVEKMDWRTI